MSRTQGYFVRLVPQGAGFAEERGDDAPQFIMEDDEPRLFVTEEEAIEAAQTYVASRPKLTYSIEPVAP